MVPEKFIRILRKAQISNASIASQMGLSRKTVNAWATGRVTPRNTRVYGTLVVLEDTLEELLDDVVSLKRTIEDS